MIQTDLLVKLLLSSVSMVQRAEDEWVSAVHLEDPFNRISKHAVLEWIAGIRLLNRKIISVNQ
tara:strand:+ start:14816 stop:15004 length:189 start_codon:yes stop_codon:yes gene_type:complete